MGYCDEIVVKVKFWRYFKRIFQQVALGNMNWREGLFISIAIWKLRGYTIVFRIVPANIGPNPSNN